jgi:hypothetical protein
MEEEMAQEGAFALQEQSFKQIAKVVGKDSAVAIYDVDADLYIYMNDEEDSDIGIVIAGPEAFVDMIEIRDCPKELTLTSREGPAPVVRAITITPGGNFYTRAAVTITVPEGVVLNVSDIRGYVRIDGSAQVNIYK